MLVGGVVGWGGEVERSWGLFHFWLFFVECCGGGGGVGAPSQAHLLGEGGKGMRGSTWGGVRKTGPGIYTDCVGRAAKTAKQTPDLHSETNVFKQSVCLWMMTMMLPWYQGGSLVSGLPGLRTGAYLRLVS